MSITVINESPSVGRCSILRSASHERWYKIQAIEPVSTTRIGVSDLASRSERYRGNTTIGLISKAETTSIGVGNTCCECARS